MRINKVVSEREYMTYWLQMRVPRSQNQSADSTAWTGFSIIIHDTVWMQFSCPYQHFITYTNVKIHSFNVPFQGFLCQFLEFTSLRYENRKRFNIYRYSPSALSVLWYYPGIRRSDETQVNNGESTARLFLLHDQIMNFDWMWTVTWFIITCYAETLCILCLRFDVHSSLAQRYCLNAICISTYWMINIEIA